jgi:hypothetical protein
MRRRRMVVAFPSESMTKPWQPARGCQDAGPTVSAGDAMSAPNGDRRVVGLTANGPRN